jgi:hypothetical protein
MPPEAGHGFWIRGRRFGYCSPRVASHYLQDWPAIDAHGALILGIEPGKPALCHIDGEAEARTLRDEQTCLQQRGQDLPSPPFLITGEVRCAASIE